MGIVISAACALALVGPCARSLKHRCSAWYAAAAVLAAAVAVSTLAGFHRGPIAVLLVPMSSGMFAFVLFSIVMFAGVCRPGSKIRVRLVQIRRPLSLVAAILACAHCACAVPWVRAAGFSSVFAGAWQKALCAFVVIALAVLALTSLSFVVERMRQTAWQRIHMLSYLFYPALCLHAALLCASSSPAYAAGYCFCGAAYVALRIRRYKRDRAFRR